MRAKQQRTTPPQTAQLPLQISLADSARLQLEHDHWEAYARDQQARANAFAEENRQLREALQAEQARTLALQRELILAQTLARIWEVQLKPWQRDRGQAPRAALGKDTRTRLLTLVHPDRWSQGQIATELAHEITVALNKLREGVA